jgi:predicted phage baseplate assembly protein
VPEAQKITRCEDECHPAETVVVPGRFRPRLREAPLTFSEPLPADGAASDLFERDPCHIMPADTPASDLLKQDARQAMAQIKLVGTHAASNRADEVWVVQRDLLGSQGQDPHFVVEMDNEGGAHLRFGDGELGRKPEARTEFRATYRVGNGPPGNVGADTITHVVLRSRVSGLSLSSRNPLPARGGTAPEPLTDAKLFAPYAFRTELRRAVTAEDYARLAERHRKVGRAAAALRWTGSWYEALVAIDPRGEVEAGNDLLDEIQKCLYPYRRIGHDLVVARAEYVPLDVALEVCVRPDFLRGHVKAALLDAFSNRTLVDGRRGFFHPDNLSFGDDVFLSELVAAAQAVTGVESVQATRLERLGEGPNGEIESGVLPLGPLEIARLDNDPDFPENGRLRLEMRGVR